MPPAHAIAIPAKDTDITQRRRTDRVSAEIPIEVRGTDVDGVAFIEKTMTTLLGRHGATIVLKHALPSRATVLIRHLASGQEAECRLIGAVGEQGDKHLYGVALHDRTVNLWDIGFPPLSKAQNAAARVLLRCEACQNSEIVYLDELEVEVFAASGGIARPCPSCHRSRIWMEAGRVTKKNSPPTLGRRSVNDRLQPRIAAKVTACVRQVGVGEETFLTENISRGGMSFKSPTYILCRGAYLRSGTLFERRWKYFRSRTHSLRAAAAHRRGQPARCRLRTAHLMHQNS